MCDDLQEKLDEGQNLARQLCEHLRDMGAARRSLLIPVKGATYELTIKLIEPASSMSVSESGTIDVGGSSSSAPTDAPEQQT